MSRDILKLSIAAKPEYISAVRMFISAVAARLDFTLAKIEDIRTAVSEGCTLAMRSMPERVDIEVRAEDTFEVEIIAEGSSAPADSDADEFSMMLIEAMADEIETMRSGEALCGFKMRFDARS